MIGAVVPAASVWRAFIDLEGTAVIPSAGNLGAPVPDADDLDLAGYLAGTADNELRVQQCTRCGRKRWPPREGCAQCGGLESSWVRVDPVGVLYTWTVVWNTSLAGFQDRVPYAAGVIELGDSEIRMLGYIDSAPSELQMGGQMAASFEEVQPGLKVPVWKVAG